jgi:hypothetical protein
MSLDMTSKDIRHEKFLPFIVLVYLVPFINLPAQTYTFDFSIDDQQLEGGVSDFDAAQSQQHMFTFDNRDLPAPFPPGQNAQYMSGVNPSDDLFMYMKRKVTGLVPFSTYHVLITVEFASIYPTNAIGVGGPPGEGVTMKAGVTLIEPDTILQNESPNVIMNIDKGNQSIPGVDMDTIGHVGVEDTTTVYTLKTNDNLTHPFTFTTDASGEAWIIVGTDSGFEATTSLYFTMITAQFEFLEATEVITIDDDLVIYPNPTFGNFQIQNNGLPIQSYLIWNEHGEIIQFAQWQEGDKSLTLPKGIYFISFKQDQRVTLRKVIVQ